MLGHLAGMAEWISPFQPHQVRFTRGMAYVGYHTGTPAELYHTVRTNKSACPFGDVRCAYMVRFCDISKDLGVLLVHWLGLPMACLKFYA